MGWNIYRTIIRLNRTDPADAEADAGTGFALLLALPFAVVLIVNPRLYDSWIILPDHYFQLSKKAKQAMEQYYKGRTPAHKEGA